MEKYLLSSCSLYGGMSALFLLTAWRKTFFFFLLTAWRNAFFLPAHCMEKDLFLLPAH
jgi:hypothetical protein